MATHCAADTIPPGCRLSKTPIRRWAGGWCGARPGFCALAGASAGSRFRIRRAMAGKLEDELVVYYVVDDYAALAQMDAARIQRLDDKLTARADVVFVCSETLLQRKRELNRNVEYSPHGVDFELFSQAQDPATEIAEAARGLRHADHRIFWKHRGSNRFGTDRLPRRAAQELDISTDRHGVRGSRRYCGAAECASGRPAALRIAAAGGPKPST